MGLYVVALQVGLRTLHCAGVSYELVKKSYGRGVRFDSDALVHGCVTVVSSRREEGTMTNGYALWMLRQLPSSGVGVKR